MEQYNKRAIEYRHIQLYVMGMNESSGDKLMLILVIKGILHILANLPIYVSIAIYQTERTKDLGS